MSGLSQERHYGIRCQTPCVVRWRRVDLKRVIEERFGVVYHERTIGKLLKQIGFSHVSARPRHPGQNAKTIEALRKTSRRL